MGRLSKVMVELVARLGEHGILAVMDRPWATRGFFDLDDLCPAIEKDGASLFLFGYGFDRGAVAALRLAGVILSDPTVRGHEAEALRMIEEGASHADVVARLRATRPNSEAMSADGTSNIVAWKPRQNA